MPIFGLWLIIWVLAALTGGEKRKSITVDEHGRVNTQELKVSRRRGAYVAWGAIGILVVVLVLHVLAMIT